MGLGTWINDALGAAGKISADIAPYVSHQNQPGPATSPAVPAAVYGGAVPSGGTPWYDQPMLVAGIGLGALVLVIGVVVLTRK